MTNPHPTETPRICHELRALDLVTASPEIGTPWVLPCVRREQLFTAKPKRKARRKSQANMVETAKHAKLPIKRLNPDGSVEIGEAKGEATGNGHEDSQEQEEEANPWHTV